jgi:hypothetical protein
VTVTLTLTPPHSSVCCRARFVRRRSTCWQLAIGPGFQTHSHPKLASAERPRRAQEHEHQCTTTGVCGGAARHGPVRQHQHHCHARTLIISSDLHDCTTPTLSRGGLRPKCIYAQCQLLDAFFVYKSVVKCTCVSRV